MGFTCNLYISHCKTFYRRYCPTVRRCSAYIGQPRKLGYMWPNSNVSSVGRTHTIVRLQTRILRKDGTENFGGFVYVLDRFPQRDLGLWIFMCPTNITRVSFPATTPRATTPHRSFPGYHAEGYHAHTYAIKLTGYHVCRVTTPELPRSKRTSGYSTPAGSF